MLDLAGSALHAGGKPAGAELANGDFVRGEVAFVNRETVGIVPRASAGGTGGPALRSSSLRSTSRRLVRVPRARTAIVRLQGRPGPAGGEKAPPRNQERPGSTGGLAQQASVQLVRLVNGDRLTGSLSALTEDVLELDTAFAGTVKLPLAMVVELWSEGGPLVPVSTMPPVEVSQTPQFDESFPHRLDSSLAGTFLSVGGKRFERGLGCHSRCELEYDLDGGFSLFVAEIGIDDSVGGRLSVDLVGQAVPGRHGVGEAVFRVLVDGKAAFESSPVRAGEVPRMVRVPVRGRKRMRLVVDFGPDGSSVGDHAAWGRAVLVRH